MLLRRALPAARQGFAHSFPIYEMGSPHLETLEASAADSALHRSVVLRAEPVDHYLPTICPVTEQENLYLRTGSIRWYPQTALAGRRRPDDGTIGRHEARLPFQSVGVGQVVGKIPFFLP